jgi:hypothetical protein
MKVLNELTHSALIILALYCIFSPVPTGLAVAAGIYIAWDVIGAIRKWDRRIRADERDFKKKAELLRSMDEEYRELLCRKLNREHAHGGRDEMSEMAKEVEKKEFLRVIELGSELGRNVRDDLAAYSYPARPNESSSKSRRDGA